MMSGNQDIDLANGSAGPRLQGFLQKPFRTRELRELLQRLLGARVPEPQKP
jgi:DNA-binding NtrC family response regulator